MIKLLVRLFIKDYKNTSEALVRKRYGIFSGSVGIAVNLLLAAAKFFIGSFVAHSIAISADAVNNFSDAASSLLTIIGFKIAGKKPDNDHPFGHGRFEHITALIVGLLVEMMGLELFRTSIDKIRNPSPVTFSYAAAAVLLISIGGKIWLAMLNRYLGKQINSPAMSAVVADSISDSASTSVALVCLIIAKFTPINIDGWAGMIVALFILYSGFGILRDTIGVLLGNPPDRELVNEVVNYILSGEGVMGVHDLVIHSYGASSVFGTIHVEFSADEDLVKTHDIIDTMEQEIFRRFNIHMVIHLDPLVFDDERVNELRALTSEVIKEISTDFSFHDFRVVEGPTHTNLIFDLLIPHSCKMEPDEIKAFIEQKLCRENEKYFAVITVEYSYLNQ